MLEVKKDGGFRVIGITVRTKNRLEMTGNEGKIGPLWHRFYSEGILKQIPKRISGEDIIAVYHDYESDVNGYYTLMIGAKVAKDAVAPAGLTAIDVPETRYCKIPSEEGQTPDIIIDTWMKIFGMAEEGKIQRRYAMDFEYYDERAVDPNSARVDIYVSVK